MHFDCHNKEMANVMELGADNVRENTFIVIHRVEEAKALYYASAVQMNKTRYVVSLISRILEIDQ